MIDFRYHIVSLISVFLALAVGIILGAGPLQDAIGDQLTGQVEQLRNERNQLRNQLDAANLATKDGARYVEAAGPQLVADSLTGRRVAIVDLDGADKDRDDALTAQLDAAGATVAAHVRLTDGWTDASNERTRETVARGLGDLLAEAPDDASPEERLAEALATSLTGTSPQSADARSEGAVKLEDQLEEFDLVDIVTEQTQPVDVILLVAGAAPASGAGATASAAEADTYVVDTEVQLASAAQNAADAAVVAGPTAATGDLVSTIRANDDLAGTLSTVSGIEAEPGRINVPLALAARSAEKVGQFGFEESATAVLPPAVVLPPVDRTVAGTPPPTDPTGETPEGEG